MPRDELDYRELDGDYLDYEDESDHWRQHGELKCRDCGSLEVFWGRNMADPDRWTLYDPNTGRVHKCVKRKLHEHRADAFDSLD